MRLARAYLSSLNPPLPGAVRNLQAGALVNALGNGLAYPFLFIYLHNVRGIPLDTAGLIVGTNAAVGLVAGPVAGTMVDRVGGKVTLAFSLWLMTIGFVGYVFVHEPWQGFLASAIAGAGNGGFWPSQSSLIAGLTPQAQRHQAFAMQRVMMNLGIGLGGLAGGLIATTSEPSSFTILFLADAATFVLYSIFLLRVPQPELRRREADKPPGGYREVLRNRVFVGVVGLNFVFIAAGHGAARDPPGLREERGRRHRARDRPALLPQHARHRAHPAPDGAPARRTPPDADAGRARRRLGRRPADRPVRRDEPA